MKSGRRTALYYAAKKRMLSIIGKADQLLSDLLGVVVTLNGRSK